MIDNITGSIYDGVASLFGIASDDRAFIDENGNVEFRTCFVAGTRVRVSNDTKGVFLKDGTPYMNIEDIKIGDMVLAIDERTGEQSYKPVKQLFVRTAPRIYNIAYEDGTVIQTTWSHPFYIKKADTLTKAKMLMVSFSGNSSVATISKMTGLENGQWMDAKNIRAGDVSVTASGKDLRIMQVSVSDRSETVYNFGVHKDHNFYVSEAGILVHNEVEQYFNEVEFGGVGSGHLLGFVARYVGMDQARHSLSKWMNKKNPANAYDAYSTDVFGKDYTKIKQNPARIIGHESDWWYTNSKGNTSYTSYDSWAEMMRLSTDYRMTRELNLSRYTGKPLWRNQNDKKTYTH